MPVSAYKYGVEIPQNSDLNTYKTPGKYVSRNMSITSTLKNPPFSDSGFRLEVRALIDPNNIASFQQIAYPGNMNNYKRFAMRTFLNDVWSDWLYFSDDATVLLATQNTTPPYMPFSSQSEADEYLNSYSQGFLIRTHYYLGVNFSFAHTPLGGGEKLIEGYKTSNNYEWQIAKQYTPTGIGIHGRSKVNGSWTEWKLLYNS